MIENIKLEQVIYSIVKEELEIQEDFDIAEDLFNYGLNSMKFIRILVELEDILNISIPDEKLLVENFSSVEKITRVIKVIIENTTY
jgi:acyl carrier protein